MSRGNAEQPSAQAPKGPTSARPVETVVQGRQETGVQARQGVQEKPATRSPQDQANGNGAQNQTPNPQVQTASGADSRWAGQVISSQSDRPQDRRPAGQPANARGSKPSGPEQKSPNGQSKDPREEQLAAGRTSAAAAGRGGPGSPGSSVRPAARRRLAARGPREQSVGAS